jgi:RNA polymerase sigma-70 factor (ECF subfamily)
MAEENVLARRFEANRAKLHAVAYRMLGSRSEAEDAVQEAWLRLSRAETGDVQNLGGWLTTVVARVCLDMLRTRKSRREARSDEPDSPAAETADRELSAEQQVLMAESIGIALLVVLETLAPAERVAYVLHDMFDLPFEEIAPIVGRTPVAARQLASRARRRVRGAASASEADRAPHRAVVDAFLAASRQGDFQALLAVLDPEVVFRADSAAVRLGSAPEVRGAAAVAKDFSGRARDAHTALVDGEAGVLVLRDGAPFVVLRMKIADGRVSEIEAVADPTSIAQLRIEPLDS